MLLGFLLKGVLVGIIIALPVGPVGVLCLHRTILDGRLAGFVSGLGAASADASFGVVAGFGLTVVSNLLLQYQDWLRVGGAVFLLYSGVSALRADPMQKSDSTSDAETLLTDFASTFVLTITNPITILVFLAVFTGLGFSGDEVTLGRAAILVLGVWVGSLLWWAALAFAAGWLRLSFERSHLVWINRGSGGILLFSAVALVASLLFRHFAYDALEEAKLVYLPPAFTETRHDVLIAHIERYDFGLLVSHGDAGLVASQIPFLVVRQEGRVLLQGHLARANPQVADLDCGEEALAIFAGPHAYISPTWYEAGPAVPTWNYAAVHAYGAMRSVSERDWLENLVRRLSEHHEAREPTVPWQMEAQPESYLTMMLRGIVGVEIVVDRLEGKFKLSQNRPKSDRPRIIVALEQRDDAQSHGVAQLMREREPASD